MILKVKQTQHSGGSTYLAGSLRNVDDTIGRELVALGICEEVIEGEEFEAEAAEAAKAAAEAAKVEAEKAAAAEKAIAEMTKEKVEITKVAEKATIKNV